MPLKKENKYNMLKFSKFRRDKDLIQTWELMGVILEVAMGLLVALFFLWAHSERKIV